MTTTLISTLESFGRTIGAWVLGALPTTAILLLLAIGIDTLIARRVRAAWRIALYAPIALRVFVSFSFFRWSPQPRALGPAIATIHIGPPKPPMAADVSVSLITWWAIAISIGYLTITALLAARVLIARVRLARLTRTAQPVVIGIAEDVPIAVHPTIGPLLENLFAPRIIVPAHLERTTSAFSMILRHEVAHLRRRDPWLLAFIQVVTIIAWPILPVWIAARRVRQLMEVACDEAAVAELGEEERRRYGHLLLDLADEDSDSRHHVPNTAALGIAGFPFHSTLRTRIVALRAGRRWPRHVEAALSLVIVIVLVACSGTGPASDTTNTKRSPIGQRGDALPSVTDRELYPCVEARVISFDGVGANWHLIEPPPTTTVAPDIVARCRSDAYVTAMHKNNWASEPRYALAQIGRDIAAAYDESKRKGKPKLCPSAAPTPPEMPAPNANLLVTEQFDKDPGWTCMMFTMTAPRRFQYRIDVTDRSFVATAHAQRTEKDGRLTDLVLVLNGQIDEEGELWLASAIDETWTAL